MPYVTVGYPSLGATGGILSMLAANGVDCLELGVPFSDPIADGVTIQHASQQALDRGVTLDDVLKQAERAARLGLRVILMSYANPLLQAGLPALARHLSSAGAQGVIVPDLPLGEAQQWNAMFDHAGIALILFATPTTPPARLRIVDRLSRAFIYYVSLTGVTGERAALPPGLAARLQAVRRVVKTPVCVGFGVSTPRQAALVAKRAEGVIVGSALVRRIAAWGEGAAKRREIGRWVRSMTAAVHRPSGC